MSGPLIELRLTPKQVEYVQEALRHYYRSQDHFGLVTPEGRADFSVLWAQIEESRGRESQSCPS